MDRRFHLWVEVGVPVCDEATDKYRDQKNWFCAFSVIATTERWLKRAMLEEVCHWDRYRQIFTFFQQWWKKGLPTSFSKKIKPLQELKKRIAKLVSKAFLWNKWWSPYICQLPCDDGHNEWEEDGSETWWAALLATRSWPKNAAFNAHWLLEFPSFTRTKVKSRSIQIQQILGVGLGPDILWTVKHP